MSIIYKECVDEVIDLMISHDMLTAMATVANRDNLKALGGIAVASKQPRDCLVF